MRADVVGEEKLVGEKLEPDGTTFKQKLGHPTLTGAGKGRIGGELRFRDGRWVMNNRSGRYSRSYADRGRPQLENAAKLLRESSPGLEVITEFDEKYLPRQQ
jgi:hypothetical protein